MSSEVRPAPPSLQPDAPSEDTPHRAALDRARCTAPCGPRRVQRDFVPRPLTSWTARPGVLAIRARDGVPSAGAGFRVACAERDEGRAVWRVLVNGSGR